MSFSIGEIYSGDVDPKIEGPGLELLSDGLSLVIQLRGLSQEEIRSFNETKAFEFALFPHEGILFALVEIPGLLEWSDAPFSLSTFSRSRWPKAEDPQYLPKLGENLEVSLIEAKNRAVVARKSLVLGQALGQTFTEALEFQRQNPLSPEECLEHIQRIQKRFDPLEMLKRATARETLRERPVP